MQSSWWLQELVVALVIVVPLLLLLSPVRPGKPKIQTLRVQETVRKLAT